MVQVSDAAVESSSSKESPPSPSSFSTLNCLLGAMALLFIVISIVFIVLFVSSSFATKEIEKELEKLKRKISEENNEPMTCAWMKECKRVRLGAPPLLVISLDGFANRYINWETAPTIKKMGECGGRAKYMYPSFPSKTFPNHYSIATGLYPGSHGIVDNSFYTPNGTKYDPNIGIFYGGEPIWNTVVKNGKESKTFHWLGSYDKINGVEATFHNPVYIKNVTFPKKIKNVTDWLLSDDPPALSMLYLEEPDGFGHQYGPDSQQVIDKAKEMDEHINYILRKLHKGGVLGCTNIIVLSDHGMRNINKLTVLDEIDPQYGKVITSTGNNVLFFGNISTTPMQCKNGTDYRVYRSSDEVPLRFHYDHENIGFPYIIGNPGNMFVRNDTELEAALNKSQKGNHGWDNMDNEMLAIFYAVGPSIRSNITLPPFQNIQLYNLFADLMKIPPAPNNGTVGYLDELLVKPPKRINEYERFNVKECEKISFEECGSSNTSLSLSSTTGYIQSGDSSICSISTGRLFLLYSRVLNKPIGMEILVKKTGSYEGEVVTKMDDRLIGLSCAEEGTKSVLTNQVFESSLKLTWTNFSSFSLVEKAVSNLAKTQSTRIQIGFVYGTDGSTKSVFVTGFWCEGEGWRREKDYCINDEESRTEAYVIPASASENFNCLDEDTLLFDYRTTFSDIEKLTTLSLLPKSMPLSTRNRIALFISTQTFM